MSCDSQRRILLSFEHSPTHGRNLDLTAPRLYAILMANVKKRKSLPKAMILGVGLDSDGHKRVTTGPNFALVGGSHETHEQMTEKTIKINEKLKARGKELHEVSGEEFDDIAHSVGLHRHTPPKKS
jgi:hypothetical protein